MSKLLESFKKIRLTINQWIAIKYFTWISINAYLWYREYPVLDALVVNLGIVIIHACVKVHSVAVGMIISRVSREDNYGSPSYFFKPPGKEDIN
tara:strand:+ start:1125 stop:1406 length:282 start_codon:yes stop_codon:yes gene_type:complete